MSVVKKTNVKKLYIIAINPKIKLKYADVLEVVTCKSKMCDLENKGKHCA